MHAHERKLAQIALVSGMSVFVVLFVYGYFDVLGISLRGHENIPLSSPLLPSGWVTYQGDGWQIGYPSEYEVAERASDHAVTFSPAVNTEKKTYFLVMPSAESLAQTRIARDTTYPDPEDVTIANYPALKYTLGTGRVEYVVEHGLGSVVIAMDEPKLPEISAMFVTFSFTN